MAAVTSCENASFAIGTSPTIYLVYPQNFVYALFSVTLGTTVKLRANGRNNSQRWPNNVASVCTGLKV